MTFKIRFAIFIFFYSILGISQVPSETENQRDLLEQRHEGTIYYLIQQSWKANKEPSYVALFPLTPSIGERRIPLRQGEGSDSDFDLIEANLNLRFPLFFGNMKGSGFQRSQRITFDYNGTFRMTLDESKPIIPTSHKVGFGYHISLFNNYTGWIKPKNDPEAETLINSEIKNFKFINLLTQVHHYSNGQASGFIYVPDPSMLDEFRNSYLDGDFSTNYLNFEITGGIYYKSTPSLHQLSLGFRRDLGVEDSVFAFTEEQDNAYGRNRLSLKYDYRTKRLNQKFEHHARFELVHIIGNLDSFKANLINDDKKYRTSIKAFFELAPKNWRTVGLFFSGYYGRDYLNIRYDDIVYSLKAGITLDLEKFYMPDI